MKKLGKATEKAVGKTTGKIIGKAIWIAVSNLVLLTALVWLLDHVGGMIVGTFYGSFHLRSWWYTFAQSRMLNFVLAGALLSGCLSLIWQLSCRYADNVRRLFLALAVGNAALLASDLLYVQYLEKISSSPEGLTLAEAFVISFGSPERMRWILGLILCLVFTMGLFVNRAGCFISDGIKRSAWLQVFSTEHFWEASLCRWFLLYLISTGGWFLVGFMDFAAVWVLPVLYLLVLAAGTLFRTVHFRKMIHYLRRAARKAEDAAHLALICEQEKQKKPFFYHSIWKNRDFMRRLQAGQLFLCPEESGIRTENCIRLDVYGEWFFTKAAERRQKIMEERAKKGGVFQAAFCRKEDLTEDLAEELASVYDAVCQEPGQAVEELLKLSGYLDFHREQLRILSGLRLEELPEANCLAEEIAAFQNYIKSRVDEFIVFDYAIKWLEITNYFYTLTVLSENQAAVTQKLQERLEYADFRKWRELQRDLLSEDNRVFRTVKEEDPDKRIYQEFDKLWTAVTARPYRFEAYSVEELLDGANKLRDYTRGHGVFTFEISQTLNLELLDILVYLLNRLIDSGALAGGLENLEALGWLIRKGGVPYFLYSVDRSFQQYHYESFRKGSSVILPMDVSR